MGRETAVVTGGAKGIGRACCLRLLELGFAVCCLDVDDGAGAELARTAGEHLHYLHCDVSSHGAVESVCREILARHRQVSVLVNNAGIQTHCLFADMTPELWQQTINVNLSSAFSTCKCLLPGMVARGYGRIVNIASMSARRGSERHTHYCAAKAGLLGFTRALSLEAARHGVTVNAVCPGIVETDMIQETLTKKRARWLEEMHVKRLGRPEDIANAVAFLIRRESDWITGQALDVNGGILTP